MSASHLLYTRSVTCDQMHLIIKEWLAVNFLHIFVQKGLWHITVPWGSWQASQFSVWIQSQSSYYSMVSGCSVSHRSERNIINKLHRSVQQENKNSSWIHRSCTGVKASFKVGLKGGGVWLMHPFNPTLTPVQDLWIRLQLQWSLWTGWQASQVSGENCLADRIHRLTYCATRRWSSMSRCGSGRRTGRTGLTGLWWNCFTDRIHRLTYRVTRRWSSMSRCGNGRRTGRTGLTGLCGNCLADRTHRLTYRATRRWSSRSRCGNGRRTGRTGLTGLWWNCFTDRVHRLTCRVTRRWSSISRCGSCRRTGRTGLTGLCGNCSADRTHRLTYHVPRRWSSLSRCGNGRRTGRTGLTGYSQVKFHEQERQRPPHWADRPHRLLAGEVPWAGAATAAALGGQQAEGAAEVGALFLDPRQVLRPARPVTNQ
jgi:hypothetical protein